jgi:tetratricopeptide (TPR) repeat protein
LPLIKDAYKQTKFDSHLRTAARHLNDYLQRSQSEETYEYWKARTLLYELNDVFNINAKINERAVRDGQSLFEELRLCSIKMNALSVILPEQRKILREKVLLCACRAIELRRQGEVNLALSVLEWLLEFTTSKLKTEIFPCYSTRATLCYHLAATLRTLEQHRRAESLYSEALELLYLRGKKLGNADHLYVTRKQAMVVGLGFGLINMTRGFLARAEHALATARSMLASVNDPLVSAYVELLYGTILRCRAGSNQSKLNVAISQLQNTLRAFMDHPRYQARTYWELALAKSLAGDISGSQKALEFVGRYADRTANQKWQVNVHILRSRLNQKQGRLEDALDLAEAAVDKAKSPLCNTILPLVDAYITRGEAFLSLADSTKSDDQYVMARENFENALHCMLERKSSSGKPDLFSNPKIAAVCTLRIAQCYVRIGNQVNAKKHFAIWLRLEPHVEHEWVRELADRIRVEIERLLMDFTISAYEPEQWDYSESVAKLRSWLLTQSLRQTKHNYSEASKLLGVQRATLYQWQTQGASSKRRRARTEKAERSSTI